MTTARKTALVAPLNWGLGHASRCIPIIKNLLDQGIRVYLASDSDALALLKNEFPYLPNFQLAPLQIHYGRYFFWSMFIQSGKFYRSIRQDNQIVNRLYNQISFDYIISDNRYGVYHPDAHNILLTHQLQLTRPKILKGISRILLGRMISPFQECWIPDVDGPNNLSGELSKPKLPILKKYIGVLSRLEPVELTVSKYRLAIVLSGPEPARSRFEGELLDQISKCEDLPGTILIRGLPLEQKTILSKHTSLTIQNYADSKQLNEIINSATYVICRAGYSSIMDLVKLGKKAILVPTPGQSEQLYLANHLRGHPAFLCVKQTHFNLSKHLQQLGSKPSFDNLVSDLKPQFFLS